MLDLCNQESLNEEQVARFQQLVADKSLNINCRKSSSYTPILLLCRRNKSPSLLPCLKLILERDDVDKKATHYGSSTLTLLCRHYPLPNQLFDCIRLLQKNGGIDVNFKNKEGKTGLFLLSQNLSKDKTLIDIARLLLNEKSDFQMALETVDNLKKRCLHRDANILSKIVESYRLGKGKVSNQVKFIEIFWIYENKLLIGFDSFTERVGADLLL